MLNFISSSNSRAILLIHGFGDTPQSLQYLAEFLYDQGLNVYIPLLPGHGSTVEQFDKSTSDQWIAAAEDALLQLQKEYTWIAVAGLSMGGAIAAVITARHPELKSLCLIAPYLGAKPKVWLAAKFTWLLNLVIRHPVEESSPESIHDPDERSRNLSYGSVTPNVIKNLSRVLKEAKASLPDISVPTLLIQSKHDNRISVAVARKGFNRIGAQKKKLIITDEGGHIITVDYGKDRVFREIYRWVSSEF